MKKSLKEKIAMTLAHTIYMADMYRFMSYEDITGDFGSYLRGLMDAEAITRSQMIDLEIICGYIVKVVGKGQKDLDADELDDLSQCVKTCGMTYDELLSESSLKPYIIKSIKA